MRRSLKIYIILFVCFLASCTQYEQVAIQKKDIPQEGHFFIVHQQQQQWFMYEARIGEEVITGKICSVIDKSLEVRFIHLYVSSDLVIPTEEHTELIIPYSEIYTAEINQRDKYKTNTLSIAGIGFYLILSLIAFLLMITI